MADVGVGFPSLKRFAHLLLTLLLAIVATAQDYRGRIEGIVTDRTQAVVVGATVTLTNTKTGITVVKRTSETGLYVFDLVDPGAYMITVEAAGFSKFIQENIVVQTRGDVTVNAALQPGARAGEHHGRGNPRGGAVQHQQPGSDRRFHHGSRDSALRPQSVQADSACT